MARRNDTEQWVDFSEYEDAPTRAAVFFGVLAYPERGAGDDGPGAKFGNALVEYSRWAAWKQYGRSALRSHGIETQPRESWEGILRRGSFRIRRRLAACRFWAKRGGWIEGDWAGLSTERKLAVAAELAKRSIRGTAIADLEYWRTALRLDRPRGPGDDKEEMLRRIRAAVNECKPVLHMAWQLDRACWACAKRDRRPIRAVEKLSWRSAWFQSESWVDGAICAAESWRRDQSPHEQNGLAASEMIELRYKYPPKFTP